MKNVLEINTHAKQERPSYSSQSNDNESVLMSYLWTNYVCDSIKRPKYSLDTILQSLTVVRIYCSTEKDNHLSLSLSVSLSLSLSLSPPPSLQFLLSCFLILGIFSRVIDRSQRGLLHFHFDTRRSHILTMAQQHRATGNRKRKQWISVSYKTSETSTSDAVLRFTFLILPFTISGGLYYSCLFSKWHGEITRQNSEMKTKVHRNGRSSFFENVSFYSQYTVKPPPPLSFSFYFVCLRVCLLVPHAFQIKALGLSLCVRLSVSYLSACLSFVLRSIYLFLPLCLSVCLC